MVWGVGCLGLGFTGLGIKGSGLPKCACDYTAYARIRVVLWKPLLALSMKQIHT